MSAESKINTSIINYLKSKTAVTSITGVGGIRLEYDVSQMVTYPCVLVKCSPSYAPDGCETRQNVKEATIQITCETYTTDDPSGSVVDSLYTAVQGVLDTATIKADLQSLIISYYQIKIQPEAGIFDDNEEVRQRILILLVKVQLI
jgi:hypothetical protein